MDQPTEERKTTFSKLLGGDIFLATHPGNRTIQAFTKLLNKIPGWGNVVCHKDGSIVTFSNPNTEVTIVKRPWEV